MYLSLSACFFMSVCLSVLVWLSVSPPPLPSSPVTVCLCVYPSVSAPLRPSTPHHPCFPPPLFLPVSLLMFGPCKEIGARGRAENVSGLGSSPAYTLLFANSSIVVLYSFIFMYYSIRALFCIHLYSCNTLFVLLYHFIVCLSTVLPRDLQRLVL